MDDLLVILAIGVGAYVVWSALGNTLGQQQRAAIASCGGGTQVAIMTASGGCPALDAVNQQWSWYPQFKVSL